MEEFPCEKGHLVLDRMVACIKESELYLSEIDGAIGDGDHGINMSKGFSLYKERAGDAELSLSEGFLRLGKVLLMEIGGSMGPLYGTFFKRMGRFVKGKERLDSASFIAMIEAGIEGVGELGVKAEVGDKTMMDTLIPAVEAGRQALERGESFDALLSALVDAAEAGKESTRELIARVGRASRLGERTKGHLDAGAVSSALLLRAMAGTIRENL